MDEEKRKNRKKGKKPKGRRKQYHPAFCNVMELALYYDRELLEFKQKEPLNTLPREIDFLVIRKEKEGEVRNELGKNFRRCNIWEFKGYADALNEVVFHKTMSYAYEYLALHSELNGIEDVTLSFLREGRPRKLISWLEGNGFALQPGPGWICRYTKNEYPLIQLINIVHKDAPSYLRILSHRADPEDVHRAAEYFEGIPEEQREKARLVMELSYDINGDLKGDKNMGGFFETYVEPLEAIIKQKDEEIEQKDAQLEQKDEQLEQKDEQLEQKDREIALLRQKLAAMA